MAVNNMFESKATQFSKISQKRSHFCLRILANIGDYRGRHLLFRNYGKVDDLLLYLTDFQSL